jgi:hypothetical protein
MTVQDFNEHRSDGASDAATANDEAGLVGGSDHVQPDGADVDVAVIDDTYEGHDALTPDVAAQEVATQDALPLGVRTGDARVDAAMVQLADLESLPISDHAQVFTEVHRALQDALVDLDRP